MAKYGIGHSKALSTTIDWLNIITAASGAGAVVSISEFSLGGEAGSSAVARIALNRPSVDGSGGTQTTITPQPLRSTSAAATFTPKHTFGTESTLSANHLMLPTFNAFGGVFSWVAPPGFELIVGDGAAARQLSIRSISGTSTVSGSILAEEL